MITCIYRPQDQQKGKKKDKKKRAKKGLELPLSDELQGEMIDLISL
jgi:hypothetical protein